MKIPAWLHPFHGRDASPAAVLLTHGTGLLAAASVIFVNSSRELSFSILQWICLALLAWDSAAGVAACLSRSTSRYYASRADLRWVFISLHFIQP